MYPDCSYNIFYDVFRKNKFDAVDFQNATLSGGVAVGAIADLMIQPGGAFIAGSLCGVVSTLGYRVIQVRIKCRVNNLWSICPFFI